MSSANADHQIFREANDPHTPADRLSELSKSSDEMVRGAVAYNESTPSSAIQNLTNDTSEHVKYCLRKRGLLLQKLIKPRKIIGNNVVFRDVNIGDAEFIVGLRTDPAKGRFLSPTSTDLQEQTSWLKRYEYDNDQVYFVIENKAGERFGTVRLYDAQGDSFCWGSWILKDGRPSGFAMESALMVYCFALALGFRSSHFDVRKGNESVWKFHERFGAERVSETSDDYLYKISNDSILSSLKRYKKFLPNKIQIEY